MPSIKPLLPAFFSFALFLPRRGVEIVSVDVSTDCDPERAEVAGASIIASRPGLTAPALSTEEARAVEDAASFALGTLAVRVAGLPEVPVAAPADPSAAWPSCPECRGRSAACFAHMTTAAVAQAGILSRIRGVLAGQPPTADSARRVAELLLDGEGHLAMMGAKATCRELVRLEVEALQKQLGQRAEERRQDAAHPHDKGAPDWHPHA